MNKWLILIEETASASSQCIYNYKQIKRPIRNITAQPVSLLGVVSDRKGKEMKLSILATIALTATIGFATPAAAENPQHVKRLLETKQCQGCNLSGANLTNAELSNANLIGADLSQAKLNGANLSNASLIGAKLIRTNLNRAKLTGANLSGAQLYAVNLEKANLSDADLSGAKLTRVNFQGATMPDGTVDIN